MNKIFCFLHCSGIVRLKLSVYFFATLILLSCNKDASVNNDKQDCNNQSSYTLIKGEWEWVSTQPLGWIVEPGHIYTPDSVGYTEQLRFADDSEYFYRNNLLQHFGYYSLEFKKDFPNPGDSTFMFFSGEKSNEDAGAFSFFQVSCDTLILDDTYVDGNRVIYKRK